MIQALMEIWDEPATRVVIGVLATSIGIVVAIYIVQRVRGFYADDSRQLNDWSSISEMREEGTLREYEYQHLRKKMAEKYDEELNEPENNKQQEDLTSPGPDHASEAGS